MRRTCIAILVGSYLVLPILCLPGCASNRAIAWRISATPTLDDNPLESSHTVTALVEVLNGQVWEPAQGSDVAFQVVEGPNAGVADARKTNADGKASLQYTGKGGAGHDRIEARYTDPTGHGHFANVGKSWLVRKE